MNSKDILTLIQWINMEKLSPKNKGFIEKMKKTVEKGGFITSAQQSFIRDLYAQSTGGGMYQGRKYA